MCWSACQFRNTSQTPFSFRHFGGQFDTLDSSKKCRRANSQIAQQVLVYVDRIHRNAVACTMPLIPIQLFANTPRSKYAPLMLPLADLVFANKPNATNPYSTKNIYRLYKKAKSSSMQYRYMPMSTSTSIG